MGLLIRPKGNYQNKGAVENTIRYITRTRKDEDRKEELYAYGSYGISDDVEQMIQQVQYVQKAWKGNDNIGRKMFHEILTITPEEMKQLGNNEVVRNLASDCANDYYESGFQVVYAVHQSNSLGCHIHFVGNAVNFETGKKYHCNKRELKEKNEFWNQRLNNYHVPVQQAIYFDSSIMKQEG